MADARGIHESSTAPGGVPAPPPPRAAAASGAAGVPETSAHGNSLPPVLDLNAVAFSRAVASCVPGVQWALHSSVEEQQVQWVPAPQLRQPGPQLPLPVQARMPAGLPPQPLNEPGCRRARCIAEVVLTPRTFLDCD